MKKFDFEEFLAKQLEDRLAISKPEVKQRFPIQDPDLIRRKLGQIGARKKWSGHEHNELFDLGKTLRDKKQLLRLRYREQESWLTFKGKPGKKQAEIETPVHYETMKRLLEMVGFRIFSSYRKYCEEYELTFGKVCLEQIKSEWFVEIEGKPTTTKSIIRRLGLEEVTVLDERPAQKLTAQEPLITV